MAKTSCRRRPRDRRRNSRFRFRSNSSSTRFLCPMDHTAKTPCLQFHLTTDTSHPKDTNPLMRRTKMFRRNHSRTLRSRRQCLLRCPSKTRQSSLSPANRRPCPCPPLLRCRRRPHHRKLCMKLPRVILLRRLPKSQHPLFMPHMSFPHRVRCHRCRRHSL